MKLIQNMDYMCPECGWMMQKNRLTKMAFSKPIPRPFWGAVVRCTNETCILFGHLYKVRMEEVEVEEI